MRLQADGVQGDELGGDQACLDQGEGGQDAGDLGLLGGLEHEDGTGPAEKIEVFRRWTESGFQP